MPKFPSQVTFDRARESPMSAIYFLVKIIVSVVVLSVISTSEVSNPPAKLLDVAIILEFRSDYSQVFFETLFVTRPWKALFVSTDDDIGGWWQRWNLDRYR